MHVTMLYFSCQADRDDALQDTFIKYAQHEGAFNGERHRKAWLIRVAKNACLDMLRKPTRNAVALEDAPSEVMIDQSGDFADSSDCAETLAAALRNLGEQYRAVLYLKYFEGYTAAEIGEILGIPESTVYTNISRGKDMLREVLADDFAA